MLDKKKVVIGMSGGVDSTVAAYLLKEQGYEVIGVTMKLWDDPNDEYVENYGGCCSLSAVEDARRVAASLDIPFYVVNFKAPFKEHVIDYFVDSYEEGETPNPCVMCNKYIKFDKLLQKAKELGAYYVATGHYAKIVHDEESNRYKLMRSKEMSKDQTYMLTNFTQDQLAHTLMPIGEFETKEEVRQIAEKLDFVIARKADSQEICFIPDNDYANFLVKNIEEMVPEGNFVDLDGNVLGRHRGIIYYTVGQRKGLGMTFGKPMYVVAINHVTNDVILGSNDDVFAKGLIAREVNWISFDELNGEMQIAAKIRHTKRESPAVIRPLGNGKYEVIFDEPQRAITPGQAVAFYVGDEVIGGGFIESVVR
ncbi:MULTISPECIES: tRNA 2-thiouridine(34) synthase MnmA [unclassified Fusibacter]|uniref:tRNA 2-thiouridine(34) synthase MnmA n=1 Tax=unclassified Fusibacter TaxID=2624464 RepID=UPI0010112EF1|nr:MULTISPECIES: tRNA 2-thiouridine(34) synthase MnmA [unclassified Fusibacter]MCK8058920.1 tRNA 2-thiouridine(34) synthase MnmA [Fusibacter sp. A2]NPE21995.1 tRNA 2-thiouridine(34) synthase MnmA [Fusibacter sp. A1]RXV61619.1 tRNA 2-thiouridine(34) synthase MnmA [Fusibacter sp. A1]